MTRQVAVNLQLSFSSMLPREVTEMAWTNSRNSMKPDCTQTTHRLTPPPNGQTMLKWYTITTT